MLLLIRFQQDKAKYASKKILLEAKLFHLHALHDFCWTMCNIHRKAPNAEKIISEKCTLNNVAILLCTKWVCSCAYC